MHPSALLHAKSFFSTYVSAECATILDIGSQNVNGSLKEVAPSSSNYVGVDFTAGKGVDVIIDDPYKLPFPDDFADVVVSSSCFEHSEMFWLVFLEIMRILKPTGLFYLNVPSNGKFHRYPVDCWRFYPDSGSALVTWAKRNGFDPLLLESFVGTKYNGPWNDFVAVFLKHQSHSDLYASRMIRCMRTEFVNGKISYGADMINIEENSPDQLGLLDRIKRRYWAVRERSVMNSIKGFS